MNADDFSLQDGERPREIHSDAVSTAARGKQIFCVPSEIIYYRLIVTVESICGEVSVRIFNENVDGLHFSKTVQRAEKRSPMGVGNGISSVLER